MQGYSKRLQLYSKGLTIQSCKLFEYPCISSRIWQSGDPRTISNETLGCLLPETVIQPTCALPAYFTNEKLTVKVVGRGSYQEIEASHASEIVFYRRQLESTELEPSHNGSGLSMDHSSSDQFNRSSGRFNSKFPLLFVWFLLVSIVK